MGSGGGEVYEFWIDDEPLVIVSPFSNAPVMECEVIHAPLPVPQINVDDIW